MDKLKKVTRHENKTLKGMLYTLYPKSHETVYEEMKTWNITKMLWNHLMKKNQNTTNLGMNIILD